VHPPRLGDATAGYRAAPQKALTKEQIPEAIRFNNARLSKEDTLWIQDVVGARKTGTWTRTNLPGRASAGTVRAQEGWASAPQPSRSSSERALEQLKLKQWRAEQAFGPKPVFDHSGGETVTIDADTAQDFARNITATIGSPHTQPGFEPDIQFDSKTDAAGREVPGRERLLRLVSR
jgi:hypothetical protein